MNEVHDFWLGYNKAANQLCVALQRTNNPVGEYAEYLAWSHYGGDRCTPSKSGIDLVGRDGTLYQVKARKISGSACTSLGIIRSLPFEYLIVIWFDREGKVYAALQVPRAVVEQHAKPNKHQNGYVITSNKAFMNDHRNLDITEALRALQA